MPPLGLEALGTVQRVAMLERVIAAATEAKDAIDPEECSVRDSVPFPLYNALPRMTAPRLSAKRRGRRTNARDSRQALRTRRCGTPTSIPGRTPEGS